MGQLRVWSSRSASQRSLGKTACESSQFGFDDLPVGFTGARRRAAVWLLSRLFGVRVGGHLYGRFWRVPSPPAGRTHGDSRSPEICPSRPSAMTCCFFSSLKTLLT
jgi:hypothetical protein